MAVIDFGGTKETVVTRKEFSLAKARKVLKKETIAIIGYGVQGPAQALNLRDSGIKVVIGNRGDDYRSLASDDGFDAFDIPTATSKGDLVMILLPDELQGDIYKEEIAGGLNPGDSLVFAHGFNILFNQIEPAEGLLGEDRIVGGDRLQRVVGEGPLRERAQTVGQIIAVQGRGRGTEVHQLHPRIAISRGVGHAADIRGGLASPERVGTPI